jgi:hypothetical protein
MRSAGDQARQPTATAGVPDMTIIDGSRAGQPSRSALSDDSRSALSDAAAAMTRLEQEIWDLWRYSLETANRSLAERLVEASRALRRAARSLEHEIGRADG